MKLKSTKLTFNRSAAKWYVCTCTYYVCTKKEEENGQQNVAIIGKWRGGLGETAICKRYNFRLDSYHGLSNFKPN